MKKYVITIARGFGSGGKTVGKILAERLDINYYDRDLIKLASEESGINISLFGKADEKVKTSLFKKYNRSYGRKIIPPGSDKFISNDNLFNIQAKIIRDLADRESCIIVGRCADYILKDYPNLVRVYFYASLDVCVRNVMDIYSLDKNDAIKQISAIDAARSAHYKYYTGKDWDQVENYDLCINTSDLSFERCASLVEDYLRIRGLIG
ncbi:MAG: cytidylate kinase-like family protein [Clostridiales bacterium]|nr:cytidylate kinase-like family protein [Clostridiales bacterium]